MKDDIELDLPHIPDWAVVLEQSADDLEDTLNALEDAHMQTMGWDPLMDWVPDDKELMSLERAVCLPILGGRMFKSEAMSIPSRSVKVKTLRAAIAIGALGTIRLNTNINVTVTLIKEWIASCENKTQTPISCNENRVTKTVSSRTKAPGTSSTETSKFRQDALSQMIKKLK